MAVATVGWSFKYCAINANVDLFVDYGQYNQHLETKYSYQKPATVGDDEQSLIESQSVNSIRLKTGSGTVLTVRKHQNQTSEALKSALKVRSGAFSEQGQGYKKNAPRKINEKFESKAVKKLVKKALNNQDVKKEYDRIKKRIEEGVNPINIGDKSI